MPEVSKELLHIAGPNVRALPRNMVKGPASVAKLGIGFAPVRGDGGAGVMRNMAQVYGMSMDGIGMDSVQSPVTTSAIPNFIQWLQNWMPGLVHVITSARKCDEILGISTIGSWEDEQVVQQQLELTGYAKPYGDYTNVPLADWNMTAVPRNVVRMELGMRVGKLEDARSARERVNDSQSKRESCAVNLEISRNLIGFYGYNAGDNNTYGFLNDPGLLAYVTVPLNAAASSRTWANKTMLEISNDLRLAAAQLQTQSQDNINPEDVVCTLVLPTNAYQYLGVQSNFGYSVRQFIRDTYPKWRIVSAPQLNAANGGAGVFYLFADSISDSSTDDGRTWSQPVPAKFMVLGVAQLAKAYEEDFTNATAGAFLKRPWAVVRFTGIS